MKKSLYLSKQTLSAVQSRWGNNPNWSASINELIKYFDSMACAQNELPIENFNEVITMLSKHAPEDLNYMIKNGTFNTVFNLRLKSYEMIILVDYLMRLKQAQLLSNDQSSQQAE